MDDDPRKATIERAVTGLLECAGLVCLIGGAFWIYPPAGLILLGLFLLAGIFLDRWMRNQ